MNSDNKAQRAQARKLNHVKDRRKRRLLVRKRQANSEGISKEEFEKRFPHLPIKNWYAKRHLTNQPDFGCDADEEDSEDTAALSAPPST